MNAIERMTKARQAAAPQRRNDIDPEQYLLDKAQRLANAATVEPVEVAPPVPGESEGARQARLIATLNEARKR